MNAEDVQQRTLALVEAGVPWVHLRDHAVDAAHFAAEADRFAPKLREVNPSVAVSINTHLGVAQALGEGLHVGRRGLAPREARRLLGEAARLGVSAHTPAEVAAAAEAGADYAFFSPVYPTASHPEAEAVGLEALAEACAAVPGFPVLALGGITPERVSACLNGGVWGVAVLSGLLDYPGRVDAYLRAIE